MSNWFHNNYKTLIISAFLIPIITVAVVSISHVTQWYGISNPLSWAVYLSIGVEIAALSALAAISADMGRKVYFPFGVVTLIQFIGNIFFAYSFINVNGSEFKQWVELSSPLVELFGVDETDLIGHKRFLAFFAGGMLPIISLSFLHMLVKFTEGTPNQTVKEEPQKIDASDLVGEISRLRLSEEDLAILERTLMNPPAPNEKLKEAAKRHQDVIKGASLKEEWALNDDEIKKRIERQQLLVEMMQKDQELGLYDEPFDNPLVKKEVVPALSDEEVHEMFMDEYERKFDMVEDDISDWDSTLMDGLEDENFSTIENKEEVTEQEFSTIEPNIENNFQEESIDINFTDEEIEQAISEFNEMEILESIEDSVNNSGVEIPDVDETWDVGTEPLVTPTLENDEDIDLKKKL